MKYKIGMIDRVHKLLYLTYGFITTRGTAGGLNPGVRTSTAVRLLLELREMATSRIHSQTVPDSDGIAGMLARQK